MTEAVRDSQGEVPGRSFDKGSGPAAGHNSLGEKAKGYVRRIEDLLGDLEVEKEKYQEAAEEIRGDIKQVYDDAERDGMPVKGLRAVVRARRLERKAAACRDGLPSHERDSYDTIRHALGDLAELPLGQAALARA